MFFVQIFYRQQYCSANLLLGWRWMVVIPVRPCEVKATRAGSFENTELSGRMSC